MHVLRTWPRGLPGLPAPSSALRRPVQPWRTQGGQKQGREEAGSAGSFLTNCPRPPHPHDPGCLFPSADWATFAVGPGHGIQLPSGRLLVPAYTYRVDRRECFGKICRTSPHAFTFYSDDHGQTWHHGGLVPNLRSGECQLAMVDGGWAGSVLYCNARSPLGSRVQALSTDEGTSFLPGELVPTLPETARGCQGSILGFPAPPSGRPSDEGWSKVSKTTPCPLNLCARAQESPKGGSGDTQGGGGLGRTEGRGDGPGDPGPREPSPGPGFHGVRRDWTPQLPRPPATLTQSPTWLL